MILKHFPGYGNNLLKSQDFFAFHRENVIVYAKSSDVAYSEHTAPLSIKTCFKGTEFYEVNNVPIGVEDGKFLVINDDQQYASYILSNEPVESFCIFFRDNLDREVSAAFACSPEKLLDDPEKHLKSPPPFFQNLRRANSPILFLLKSLHRELDNRAETSQLWLDEQSNRLMEILLHEHRQTLCELQTLPMIRPKTRLEIYKRLSLARDYIESCYDEPVNLKKLSQIACLSPHHFLRLFKAAFRQTPHQYLIDVRLQQALKLIKEGNFSITDICFNVGFENLSSFIRLFKNRFRLSPTEFRRKKQPEDI